MKRRGRGLWLLVPPLGDRGGDAERFTGAVTAEAERLDSKLKESTLLVGFAVGGTGDPGNLPEALLGALLRGVTAPFALSPGAERSFETSLESITKSKIELLVQQGITRIVYRVFEGRDAATLPAMARHARDAGLRVSVDYPFRPRGAFDEDRLMETVLAAAPDHISLVEEEEEPVAEEEWAAKYDRLDRRLGEAGYERYALTHYCRPRRRSVVVGLAHGGGDEIALGPGGATRIGAIRRRNEPDPARYTERLLSGGSAVVEAEELSPSQRLCEAILAGLTRTAGIAPNRLEALTGAIFPHQAAKRIVEGGWLARRGGRLHLTRRGIPLADRIAAELAGAGSDVGSRAGIDGSDGSLP